MSLSEAKYRSQDPDSIVFESHMTQPIPIGWQPPSNFKSRDFVAVKSIS